jgi:hypothetical protein
MIHRSSLSPRVSNFVPIGKKALARRLPDEKELDLGEGKKLHLPNSGARIFMATLEIASVGPKCEIVKVGDRVLMPRQLQFSRVEIDEKMYEVIPEDSFAAVLS